MTQEMLTIYIIQLHIREISHKTGYGTQAYTLLWNSYTEFQPTILDSCFSRYMW